MNNTTNEISLRARADAANVAPRSGGTVSLHMDAYLDRDSGETHWYIDRYDTVGAPHVVIARGQVASCVDALDQMRSIMQRMGAGELPSRPVEVFGTPLGTAQITPEKLVTDYRERRKAQQVSAAQMEIGF